MSEPARIEYTLEVSKSDPASITVHHATGGTAITIDPTPHPVRISIHEVPMADPD
ncbi:hypothetical protein [Streptomyces sp. 8N706]|uniref:hypothetical protein n=1 Tax=Streptomyces sp. 8N706 TaxID=3457416 RepID=UPI003FD3689D